MVHIVPQCPGLLPVGCLAVGYEEPLRFRPPRTGRRPGTAAGDPQTPF
jgi:hypothetical protein